MRLKDFNFRYGAKRTFYVLNELHLTERTEILLFNHFGGSTTERELNDFFTYEFDRLAKMLGYIDFAELENLIPNLPKRKYRIFQRQVSILKYIQPSKRANF